MNKNEISFNNTKFAFRYKSDKDLKKSKWLFSIMGNQVIVGIGARLTPLCIKARMPVKGLIRNTIYHQFVGGESLHQTARIADLLEHYDVNVILDYGIEGGNSSNTGCDSATTSFLEVIDFAATQKNIPFISVKVTGLSSFNLLEKINALMPKKLSLLESYAYALNSLDTPDRAEWEKVCSRMWRICSRARKKNIGVLIDAEETWIQEPVDALVMMMMRSFNDRKAIVYNTVQHYRYDRIAFLKNNIEQASKEKFILGVKLVRGAYMEKERSRAIEKGYESPIQHDKPTTDRDFDYGVKICIDHLHMVSLLIASHNEASNMQAILKLKQDHIPLNHPNIHFSQLFGMSDHITFNLAQAGCNVSKYLPFGPIEDVIPYLMRRARENTSVKGQTGRELSLIKSELTRRQRNGK